MNKQIKNTLIIGCEPITPTAIKVGFTQPVDIYDKIRVNNILTYWAESNAICKKDGNVEVQWDSKDITAIVTGDFYAGGFDGDLTHRDAIGWGDKEFNIGLTKLFYDGYVPKTEYGRVLTPPIMTPVFILIEKVDQLATVEELNEIQYKRIMSLKGETILLEDVINKKKSQITQLRETLKKRNRQIDAMSVELDKNLIFDERLGEVEEKIRKLQEK